MNHPESKIQKDIVSYLRDIGVPVMLGGSVDSVKRFAYGNDTWRVINQAKAMGYQNGQTDLIVFTKDKVLLLEVKSAIGKQSDNQKEFEQSVQNCGACVYLIVRSVEDVKSALVSFAN